MNRRDVVRSTAIAATGAAVMAAGVQSTAGEPAKAATSKRPAGPFITTRDGASIFVNDWGQGKPVVFTHAWGLNADIWEYQLTELVDQGLRCVAYDRRGHGRSSDPGQGYDYDTLADDLAAVIEQLDLHDITLVGFSMGNGEAVRYLSRHGAGRVSRLLMVSAIGPQTNGSLWGAFIAGLKQDRPAFFANSVTAFTGGLPSVSPALAQWVVAQFLRASPKAAIECMRVNTAADFHADMQAVNTPTLIVHGGQDQVNPIDKTARKAAEVIRGCELNVYEDAPHGLVITHRERLTRDLLTFIRA
jgi:pimeloyl-ACP methyl ester carboxylesterase